MQRLLLLLFVVLAGIVAAWCRFRKSIVDEDPVEKEKYPNQDAYEQYQRYKENLDAWAEAKKEEEYYKHGI